MNPAERKKFRNTSAPHKWLSVEMLIGMLKIGFPLEHMPAEVQSAVREALKWRRIQHELR